jgi:hypothetical protein
MQLDKVDAANAAALRCEWCGSTIGLEEGEVQFYRGPNIRPRCCNRAMKLECTDGDESLVTIPS